MATQTNSPTHTPHAPLNLSQHKERVRQELTAAGSTRYGLKKFAVHYLPCIVHPYEHIVGVVYGRYGSGGFFNSMNEGMLIATNRRVIFLDHKPGFTDVKEFTYDVISGIERVMTGFSSAVTLYTKIGDFNIHNANTKCVDKFTDYIESRRIETESS